MYNPMRQKNGGKKQVALLSFARLETILQENPKNGLGAARTAYKGEGKRADAEEIVGKAKERAAFIENEAYEKGYAQGEKDGFEFGKEKFMMALQNFSGIIREINDLKASLYKEWEQEILNLLLVMAKKVIQHEVETSPELIKYAVREALKYVVENSKVRIRVHPQDFAFVDEVKQSFLNEIAGLKYVEMIEDRNIMQGGCVLETDFGDVDATTDSQLAGIGAAIDKVLKGSTGRANVESGRR